jgi:TonB family protein
VLKEVLPEVTQQARRTIRGTVRVSVNVQVDPSGNVGKAQLDSRGSSRYFSQLALEAARDWKFRAPTRNGQNLASNWRIRFEFDRATTEATATQISR